MTDQERSWLLRHLDLQGRQLAEMTSEAADGCADALIRARDQLFVLGETLDTLGVPLALASHAAWSAAIHSPRE